MLGSSKLKALRIVSPIQNNLRKSAGPGQPRFVDMHVTVLSCSLAESGRSDSTLDRTLQCDPSTMDMLNF